MKKVFVAIVLASATLSAFASCPAGTMYKCYPQPNGKMMCGCF